MGQRQKRRSEEGEEGTSELENNEYGSVESRERTEKEFLVMEKSRRRAMSKRLPRSTGFPIGSPEKTESRPCLH